jgi:NAD(P)-dependent dehydrogenase (short-subunit alcohol dehydrogenase family)
VTPALIDTDTTAAVPAKALEQLRAAIPVRRIGRPDGVARVVGFLAADDSIITGQAWAVNGGLDM